ncbi:MAG UNVERIFIED_CONTAM: hypothetical protein LOD86_13710 [Thermobifida fusca]
MAEYERFLDIAGGDRALAKLLHQSLTHLEQGVGGPALQELARDVLSGRTDLREVANSSAYAEAFQESLRRFHQWRAEAGPEEVARLAEQAEQRAAELRAELAPDGPDHASPPGPS